MSDATDSFKDQCRSQKPRKGFAAIQTLSFWFSGFEIQFCFLSSWFPNSISAGLDRNRPSQLAYRPFQLCVSAVPSHCQRAPSECQQPPTACQRRQTPRQEASKSVSADSKSVSARSKCVSATFKSALRALKSRQTTKSQCKWLQLLVSGLRLCVSSLRLCVSSLQPAVSRLLVSAFQFSSSSLFKRVSWAVAPPAVSRAHLFGASSPASWCRLPQTIAATRLPTVRRPSPRRRVAQRGLSRRIGAD